MIDRVVVTVFPGYFFMSVLCLKSIDKYFHNVPITLIVDDFGLDLWNDFADQYQQYIQATFPTLNICFRRFSELDKVDDANMGGWFRQQLIKLYIDHFVDEENILLIDADVILEELPKLDHVPAIPVLPDPISAGFQLYIQHMLGIDPWLDTKEQNLCASRVPIRYVTRSLIQALRNHVEVLHKKNFLDLHIDLMRQQKIVAYDPAGKTMTMSEFEMLEVFRKYLWKHPLPLRPRMEKFYHTSEKDWKKDRSWFESQAVLVTDQHWHQLQTFGSNPVYQTGNQ